MVSGDPQLPSQTSEIPFTSVEAEIYMDLEYSGSSF